MVARQRKQAKALDDPDDKVVDGEDKPHHPAFLLDGEDKPLR
jgi:hypothetical protein